MAFRGVCILIAVVDLICFNLVAEMLKGCAYEILFTGKPLDALNAICDRKEGIRIMVSNLHRIQSQITNDILYHIQKKLKLETYLMSPPDIQMIELTQENDLCVAYLVDPSSIVDVSNFWKTSAIEEITKAKYSTSIISSAGSSSSSTWNQESASSSDNQKKNEDDVELDNKSRVVWTEELHRKFLNAIHSLLPNEKPVPKRIMELMAVKGLKRKPVTSHLQKYNLRVSKKDKNQHSSKQMGLNMGSYPIFMYPIPPFGNLIPAAIVEQAAIPEVGNPVAMVEQAEIPEEGNPAAIVEQAEHQRDVQEENNPAEVVLEEENKEKDPDKDDDGHVSTLVDNFWTGDNPPSLN